MTSPNVIERQVAELLELPDGSRPLMWEWAASCWTPIERPSLELVLAAAAQAGLLTTMTTEGIVAREVPEELDSGRFLKAEYSVKCNFYDANSIRVAVFSALAKALAATADRRAAESAKLSREV